MYKILVINTGSTSTKIAVFHDLEKKFEENVVHLTQELSECKELYEQIPMRKRAIDQFLIDNNLTCNGFDAIAARGGTFGMAQGGAYLVEKNLLEACKHPITNHSSNLSALIAAEYAAESNCKAFIYDAVCVNEVEPIARMTGLSGVKRRPFSHVLNTRATARAFALEQGNSYENMTFIVAHLGGGISINIHVKGKIIDLCSDDEGPMSPERVGKLNGKSFADLCFSGKYDKNDFVKLIKGNGGLVSHLGTNSLIEVESRIRNGDETAKFVLEAMAYQIAKEIGALATVAEGEIDAIILTGGGAFSSLLTEEVSRRIKFIAPVSVIPGAREMQALAEGAFRVLTGQEEYRIYQS